jgi:hypothetical protein
MNRAGAIPFFTRAGGNDERQNNDTSAKASLDKKLACMEEILNPPPVIPVRAKTQATTEIVATESKAIQATNWGRVPSTILIVNKDDNKVQIDGGALFARWENLDRIAWGQTTQVATVITGKEHARRSPSDITDEDESSDEEEGRVVPYQKIDGAATLWNKVLLTSYLNTSSPHTREKIAAYLRSRVPAADTQHPGDGSAAVLKVAPDDSTRESSSSSSTSGFAKPTFAKKRCDSPKQKERPCRRCERIQAGGRQASRICRSCGKFRAKCLKKTR